jgi:hypothetical protein
MGGPSFALVDGVVVEVKDSRDELQKTDDRHMDFRRKSACF